MDIKLIQENQENLVTGEYPEPSHWVEVVGPPGAPPVVLVHGSTVTHKSWEPQMAALAGRYRLIAPDLPGHGALADYPFRMAVAAALVEVAVDHYAGGRAVLVGVSLGGHVASLFACRRPHKTAGLVISGASMNFHGLLGRWVRLVGTVMARWKDSDRLRRQAEGNMRRKWPAEIAEAQVKAGVYPLGAAQSFLELPRYDFLAMMNAIQAPVLILNGEFDRPNRKGEQAFAAAASQGQVVVVPGAGHACNLENAASYNKQLEQFLSSIGW